MVLHPSAGEMEIDSTLTEKGVYAERTVRKEGSKLLRFIRKRVRDEEDAKDIFQDVLAQFAGGYEEISAIEKMTGWLFRVARNRITDWYRKKKTVSFSSLEATEDEEGEPLSLAGMIADFGPLPDDEMMRDLIWSAFESALMELPEEQRSVFVAHEFDEKSFGEISRDTGVPVNTLLSRKRYAVLFLRKRLAFLREK